jgi:hypothetical protein
MKLKSVQSGFNNVQSTSDFESPVQETFKPQVPADQTAANQAGATTGPVPAQNQGTAKEAGGAAHKAAMRLDGKLQEAALRHKLTNSYENGTKGSDALPKKNIDGVRQVMLSDDGAKKFSQIKPVLSEMISRLPGSDSHTENVKANLQELLHMVNIDSSKSKIGPEKQSALNRFTGAVSRAAASINPNSTTPLGTTVKTLIAEVKSTGGAPLPKHVDDGLGKLTDLLDKAHAEKATPDKAQMDGAVRVHTDDSWWKTAGTTSAVVVGVVSAVTGAFTFGGPSAAVLPAAAVSGALGTAAGGISAATATFGAAATTATVGGAVAAGVVTTTLAATGGAAAAAAFAALGPVLTTAATGGVLNEMQNAVTNLLDSLW